MQAGLPMPSSFAPYGSCIGHRGLTPFPSSPEEGKKQCPIYSGVNRKITGVLFTAIPSPSSWKVSLSHQQLKADPGTEPGHMELPKQNLKGFFCCSETDAHHSQHLGFKPFKAPNYSDIIITTTDLCPHKLSTSKSAVQYWPHCVKAGGILVPDNVST